MQRWRDPIEGVLATTPPLLVAVAWVQWALKVVDLQERAIRPLSGLAYATFVQLAWAWSHGYGWVQTVHRGYAEDWRWGGHYAPILFANAWLASLSTSPWALARVQVIVIGLGCVPAWFLGLAEAGLLGAIAGVAIYAGCGSTVQIALADYQDLAFCIPLFPLAVWAARHGGVGAWCLAAVLLGSTREELVVLLPLVGLTGGWKRAGWGLLVALGYGLVYRSMGAPPYPNPLGSITEWQVSRGVPEAARFAGIRWDLYGMVAGSGWPWLVAAPITALAGVPAMLFHHQDPTSVKSVVSPAVHHFAPMVGAAVAAGIVGAARLMRLSRWAAVGVLLAVGATTWYSLRSWESPLRSFGIRVSGASAEHPAWALLQQVPEDAVLLVPAEIAPAAARRRYVVTPDSVGDRVSPGQVAWAIDTGGTEGELVATSGKWRLVRNPTVVVQQVEQRTGLPQ